VLVEFHVLGWPEDGPRLELDHERFAYAGNFRTGRTGVAVAVPAGTDLDGADRTLDSGDGGVSLASDLLAATSFDEDRAATDALRIRYVTVREDRRGEGIGPRLLAFVARRAGDRGFERVRIGVNNPIAYSAAYRARFAFTGEESGMGELVLERPAGERSDRPERSDPAAAPDPAKAPDPSEPLDRSEPSDPPETSPTERGESLAAKRYQRGLAIFADRELTAPQREALERHRGGEPPAPIDLENGSEH